MEYKDAKKLRKHDIIRRKSDNKSLQIEAIRWEPVQKTVRVLCDDGNLYHHRQIKAL